MDDAAAALYDQLPSAPVVPTLIMDNGGHSIRTLYHPATPDYSPSYDKIQTYRNAIVKSKNERRNFVADEFNDECNDFGQLVFRVPCDRGILNNWDVEKTVWDRVFGYRGRGMKINPHDTPLLLTEPVFNLPNVGEHYDQMIFEEYEFASYMRCPGPALVPFGPDAKRGAGGDTPECVLVVDAGFSFTHIVPVVRGAVASAGVRRIDVGGKLMTNYLKELVSFRQWYMMDQTSVIERAKEECCYVTQQWARDWEIANSSTTNEIVRTYVLPDFLPDSTNKLGYVRPPPTGLTPPPPPPPRLPTPPPEVVAMDEVVDSRMGRTKSKGKGRAVEESAQGEEEQLLQMNNERFTVPEVLFNPSTLDMNQAGLSETIADAISSLPEEIQALMWHNIVLVGGTTSLPGFADRVRLELRSLAPTTMRVNVTQSESPTLAIAISAAEALTHPAASLQDWFVSRAEYQEGGSNACRRKFGTWYLNDELLKEEIES